MTHTPAIWLSRRILSQIEDLSTSLDSASEGALIYGSKRKRDKNGGGFLCESKPNSYFCNSLIVKDSHKDTGI